MDLLRRHRVLSLIALLGLLLRLGWALSRSTSPASIDLLPDQREYLSLADNLTRGRGLTFYDARLQSWLVSYRMPGYPLLVAACGGRVRVVRTAQALLDTSTIFAVWLLASRLLPIAAGGRGRGPDAAALLVAVNPFLIYFCGLILSETLFVALLLWAMWLLTFEGLFARNAGRILLALSILVRPSALLLPVLLVATCPIAVQAAQNSTGFTSYLRTWRWRRVAASLAWSYVWIALALLPWAIRNHRPQVLGRWVLLTTNSGITAYDGMNPRADGSSNQAFVKQMPELRNLDEKAKSDYLQHLAQQYASAHPLRAVQLAGLKILRTWSPVPLSDSFSGLNYRLVALIFSGCLDVLTILGLIRNSLGRRSKAFLLSVAIYFTVVHAMSVGSLRYRLPCEPPMAILAASVFTSARARRTALTQG